MRRFVVSILVLAAVHAVAQPGLADPLAAPPPDHEQAAAVAKQPPARPAPASASADATAPADAGRSDDIVPVGFGWG